MGIVDAPSHPSSTSLADQTQVSRGRIDQRGKRPGRVPPRRAERVAGEPPSGRARVRYPEIDLLKAVSIATVVLIHAVSSSFRYGNLGEKLLADGTRFAVPAFLFAAGFLLDKTRRETGELAGKLCRRIVPPYLVCSLAVTVWLVAAAAWWGAPSPPGARDVVWNLATGSSLGLYYFAFVIAYLYAFSLWLRKWPAPAVYALFAAEFLAFLGFWLGWLDFTMPTSPKWFWPVSFRHPAVHLLPFLAGWIVSMHYHKLRPLFVNWGGWILAVALSADLVVLSLIEGTSPLNGPRPSAAQLLIQAHIGIALFALLALGVRVQSTSRAILFLSSASYAIYLVHMPFVKLMHLLCLPLADAVFPVRILVTWSVALAAAVLLVLAMKRLLPKHSSLLVGY